LSPQGSAALPGGGTRSSGTQTQHKKKSRENEEIPQNETIKKGTAEFKKKKIYKRDLTTRLHAKHGVTRNFQSLGHGSRTGGGGVSSKEGGIRRKKQRKGRLFDIEKKRRSQMSLGKGGWG